MMKKAIVFLGFAALFLVLIAPLGYRFGVWDFAVALKKITIFGALFAFITVILGSWFVVRGPRPPMLMLAWLSGVLVSAFALWGVNSVRSVPAIHDITTNVEDAPQFIHLAAARDAKPNNGAAYKGGMVSKQQLEAYPELASVQLKANVQPVFDAALAIATEQNWELSGARKIPGHLEATITTAIYGFKDDVVIRIRPNSQGSVVDMRSASRVGKSDLGVNAKRIKMFLTELRARVGE